MTDELKHYGVLGMKWGVHKARSYAFDRNNYIRKQNNKLAKIRLKKGEITKDQYKDQKYKNLKKMIRDQNKAIDKTSDLKPEIGKRVSSIYEKERNKTLSTIPHYKLKKGAKKAASLLLSLGASTVTFGLSGATSISGFIPSGPGTYWSIVGARYGKHLAKTYAISKAEDAATSLAIQEYQNRKSKKRKEASKK